MDILVEMGSIFLGSRLKRLAERMQAGAGRFITEAGLPVQPAHMPLLTALDRQAMTVGELVNMVGLSQPAVTRTVGQLVTLDLVLSERGEDQRQRTLSLTPAGRVLMARTKTMVWPGIGAAVDSLCADISGNFLDQVAALEVALEARSLDVRAAREHPARLTLREYDETLAADFRDINAEWIDAMFTLEPTDRDVLEHPYTHIIAPGGTILFVEAAELGVVGTCALQKSDGRGFELTKMGVRQAARGRKAGEFLLAAMIERACAMGADPLYLLTNRRCAAAIHLYEKLGFRHDADIMAQFGARYQRCDVAMRYAR